MVIIVTVLHDCNTFYVFGLIYNYALYGHVIIWVGYFLYTSPPTFIII